MSLVSAEVIESPEGKKPFLAIYKHGNHIIFQQEVETVAEGEAWIVALLYRLKELASD